MEELEILRQENILLKMKSVECNNMIEEEEEEEEFEGTFLTSFMLTGSPDK
jgi:hypothetical protein